MLVLRAISVASKAPSEEIIALVEAKSSVEIFLMEFHVSRLPHFLAAVISGFDRGAVSDDGVIDTLDVTREDESRIALRASMVGLPNLLYTAARGLNS